MFAWRDAAAAQRVCQRKFRQKMRRADAPVVMANVAALSLSLRFGAVNKLRYGAAGKHLVPSGPKLLIFTCFI